MGWYFKKAKILNLFNNFFLTFSEQQTHHSDYFLNECRVTMLFLLFQIAMKYFNCDVVFEKYESGSLFILTKIGIMNEFDHFDHSFSIDVNLTSILESAITMKKTVLDIKKMEKCSKAFTCTYK